MSMLKNVKDIFSQLVGDIRLNEGVTEDEEVGQVYWYEVHISGSKTCCYPRD